GLVSDPVPVVGNPSAGGDRVSVGDRQPVAGAVEPAGGQQCRHRRGDSAAAVAKEIVHQLGPAQGVADRKRPAGIHEMASSSCWSDVVPPGLVVVAIATRYKGYRYPIEVIGHAVWLYHCFALSLRDVEEMMLARGVVVTYETIRSWCAKFGPNYA